MQNAVQNPNNQPPQPTVLQWFPDDLIGSRLAKLTLARARKSPIKYTRDSGQHKLFSMLFDFVHDFARAGDLLVYAGSTPGYSIAAVAEMFPEVHFMCYDIKASPIIHHPPNMTIRQQELTVNSFGPNDRAFLPLRQRYGRVLYFGDIRTENPTRSRIMEETLMMLEHAENARAHAFMVKCHKSSLPRQVPSSTAVGQPWFNGSGEFRIVGCSGYNAYTALNTVNFEAILGPCSRFTSKLSFDNMSRRMAKYGYNAGVKRGLPKHLAQLRRGGWNETGVIDSELTEEQLARVRKIYKGELKRAKHLKPCAHGCLRFFRNNARFELLSEIPHDRHVIAIGGNAGILNSAPRAVHCTSPNLSQKDMDKHTLWEERGLEFCSCKAEQLANGTCCRKCKSILNTGKVAFMMVDVAYYVRPSVMAELVKKGRVYSYHHHFKGKHGRLFGNEAAWIREEVEEKGNVSDKVRMQVRGEGAVYEHSDTSDIERAVSHALIQDWGEGGAIWRYSPKEGGDAYIGNKTEDLFKRVAQLEKEEKEEKVVDGVASDLMSLTQPSLHLIRGYNEVKGRLPSLQSDECAKLAVRAMERKNQIRRNEVAKVALNTDLVKSLEDVRRAEPTAGLAARLGFGPASVAAGQLSDPMWLALMKAYHLQIQAVLIACVGVILAHYSIGARSILRMIGHQHWDTIAEDAIGWSQYLVLGIFFWLLVNLAARLLSRATRPSL